MAYIIDMCVSAAENGHLYIFQWARGWLVYLAVPRIKWLHLIVIYVYTHKKEFMYQEKGNQYYDVR